ncbi:hypothetical protein [Streptomyces sp. NPDC001089]
MLPHLAELEAEEDPRLWAVAYTEFFVRDADPACRRSRLVLERESRFMTKAMANFAMFLMDAVWLPVHFGVEWTTPWCEVDSLRRTSPGLRDCLLRRDRYRHVGQGHFGRPRHHLRRTAKDVVGMVWVAYQAECSPGAPDLYGSDAVVAMLGKYRARFSHTGDGQANT